jgi:transcription termination factor NusB
MHFRTILSQKPQPNQISLKDALITVGSCFSDAIGKRLTQNKFNTLVNPFGTIYNPVSIHQLLNMAANEESLPAYSFIEREQIYANYLFHSQFNELSHKALEENLNAILQQVKQQLQLPGFLLITYGTAWVYTEKKSGRVVANCHKMPAELFEKRLLSVQEIKEDFERLKQILQKINNKLTIILTISPVRHLKDTLELNSVSKSVLRLACHEIVQEHSQVVYFPAYEIMMDDLRDYRFYKDDLIHPTAFAEDYIWEKFEQTYFDADTIAFIKKWKEIKSALAHKPFQPSSTAHQQFLKSLYTKVSELKNMVNVEEELSFIKSQITGNL